MMRTGSTRGARPALALVFLLGLGATAPLRAQCPAGTLPRSSQQLLTHGGRIQGYPPALFDVERWDPAEHPAGAVLTRVELALDTTIGVDLFVENLSPNLPCNMAWGAHQEITLQQEPTLGVPKVVVDPSVAGSAMLTVFDGILDYRGTSGHTWLGETATDAAPAVVLEAPEVLAAWTGSGTLSLSHTGSGSILGAALCDGLTIDHLDAFIARLRVTYSWCEPAGVPYCFGDGSGFPCPCGNDAAGASGCLNSAGVGGVAETAGSLSVALDDLVVLGQGLAPGQPALCFAALGVVNGGAGIPFGDGLRCAGGGAVRLGTEAADAAGAVAFGPGLAERAGWLAGDQRFAQVHYRDPGGPCGGGFNLTNGLELILAP